MREVNLDAKRKSINLTERPGKPVVLLLVGEAGGHPELETGLVFRGKKVIGAHLPQSQARAILGGECNHRLLHVPSHDPAAQYKVDNPSEVRFDFQTQDTGQPRVSELVLYPKRPQFSAVLL